MASASQKTQAFSPATVCGVSPDGMVQCCALVIETYTSPEFPQAEIVNVEERSVAFDSGHPEQAPDALCGNQSVG